jgi:hypothetical protein
MRLDQIDWDAAGAELDAHGHVRLPSVSGASMGDAKSAAFADAFGAELHARLCPTADRWAAMLSEPPFACRCPTRATLDVLTMGERRRLEPEIGLGAAHPFPLRATLLLSEPGQDFTGGEMVTIEQRPRMQSRPSVIVARRGDLVIFAAGARPVRGTSGVYRTRTKHALSVVRSGRRVALDLVFG